MNDTRALLRHTVATVAYRGGKAVRGASPAFPAFATGHDAKTPLAILAHIGDLFDWALSTAKGAEVWNRATPLAWDEEVARFFSTLAAFDAFLASDAPLAAEPERLFQGPVADALTHVGQLSMLRRLAGCPIRAENFYRADIVAGRVGEAQTAPNRQL